MDPECCQVTCYIVGVTYRLRTNQVAALYTKSVVRSYLENLMVLLLKALARADGLNRDDLLNKENLKQGVNPVNSNYTKKFYCVTTYNPGNPPMREIITKNWDILGKTKCLDHF